MNNKPRSVLEALKFLIALHFIFINASTYSQDSINRFDESGKRHGTWIGYFEEDTEQVRFRGTFKHGEETGLFQFYQPGYKKPAATKYFHPDSDTVDVQYLTQRGGIISEGQMREQDRIGEWKYYHRNSEKLMMTETYEAGILDGPKITYFPNGQMTEKAFYKDGNLHGEVLLFSEKGVILKEFHYVHGELHGPTKVYNGKGELIIEGQYKKDKHAGIWKYYENGELTEEKDFSSR